MACKPGSVPARKREMTIPLGRPSPDASRDLPGRQRGNALCAVPIWSCSRWGLPCRLRCRRRGALLPHRFTLTRANAGRLFSVALSLESPPPDVIRHRVSVEPGLSSPLLREQPSGHLTPAQCRQLRRESQSLAFALCATAGQSPRVARRGCVRTRRPRCRRSSRA